MAGAISLNIFNVYFSLLCEDNIALSVPVFWLYDYPHTRKIHQSIQLAMFGEQ